jgi:hypothetical protein
MALRRDPRKFVHWGLPIGDESTSFGDLFLIAKSMNKVNPVDLKYIGNQLRNHNT